MIHDSRVPHTRLKQLNASEKCSAEFNAYAACMDYNRCELEAEHGSCMCVRMCVCVRLRARSFRLTDLDAVWRSCLMGRHVVFSSGARDARTTTRCSNEFKMCRRQQKAFEDKCQSL